VVESELIRAAQSGDRDALITLLREIEQHVYRTAYWWMDYFYTEKKIIRI